MSLGKLTWGGLEQRETIFMIIVHSIKSLQESFEARASEWMLTGATICLGFVFFLNSTMFHKESFEGLRGIIGNQYIWAAIFTIVGFARLAVLLINGAYWRTPHFRAAGAFLCSGVWFVFCLSFVRNGSILIAIMPWIFLLDAYNVKRASREAGKSEFIQRYVKSKEVSDAGSTRKTHP